MAFQELGIGASYGLSKLGIGDRDGPQELGIDASDGLSGARHR